MNRVLKAMVLFFILTGIPWQAVAFSEADLQALKLSLNCPNCDLADADLSGANLTMTDLTGAFWRAPTWKTQISQVQS